MDILTPSLPKVGRINTKEILVVGFEDDAFAVLSKHKNGSRNYHFTRISSSFQAFRKLNESLQNDVPNEQPQAILCDIDFLREDFFNLLKKIRTDKFTNNIPFITLSARNAKLTIKEAALHGIDDHFSLMNLKWSVITKRIEFLRQFKQEISLESAQVSEPFMPYSIPFKKRLFDIFFACCVLLALSPLLLLVAIAVKLESKGGVFYFSKRAGSGYKTFDFIKFRSMGVNADAKLVELAHLNQYDGSVKATAPTFVKLQNDPRVTRVGKLIRKTSIDELPQLFNVLKGDMSIVGNRPLPLYEAEQLTKDQWITRFHAPAGLTGLWQISKRGKKDMSSEERIMLDIDYAKKYSIRMDLKILLKTLPAMIQDEQV